MLIAVGVAVGLGVLAVGWWCAPRLVPHQDECWYLLVVRRVAAGRRLYRGVFFGAGPWSVWVARAVVRLLGERLLVLRRTVVVLSVVLGGAAWAWTSAVGVPWQAGLAVAAGSVLLSTALWSADNQYGLWSRIGILVALAATLALDWPAGGVVGGLGLAIALLNKYTLGVIAGPGLLATAAATGGSSAGLRGRGVGRRARPGRVRRRGPRRRRSLDGAARVPQQADLRGHRRVRLPGGLAGRDRTPRRAVGRRVAGLLGRLRPDDPERWAGAGRRRRGRGTRRRAGHDDRDPGAGRRGARGPVAAGRRGARAQLPAAVDRAGRRPRPTRSTPRSGSPGPS